MATYGGVGPLAIVRLDRFAAALARQGMTPVAWRESRTRRP